MRVIHVVDRFDPAYGGPTQAVDDSSSLLLAAGVESVVWTTDGGPAGRLPLQAVGRAGLTQRVFPSVWPHRRGISPKLLLTLQRQVASADVVHCHGVLAVTTSFAARIARKRGTPYIVTPMGMLDRWGLRNSSAWLKRMWIAGVDGPNLVGAAVVQATSPHEESELRQLVADANVVLVPHPIEPNEYVQERGIQRRSNHLLYLGRLHPKKRVVELIEAFKRSRLHPEWDLTIAGTGGDSYTAEISAAIGSDTKVRLVGEVRGGAKYDLLQSATAFVLPSFDENFGVAVIEAAYSGCVLLVSEGVGVSSYFFQNDAAINTGTDTHAIVDALNALKVVNHMVLGELARNVALRNFAPAVLTKSLLSMYERAVGS